VNINEILFDFEIIYLLVPHGARKCNISEASAMSFQRMTSITGFSSSERSKRSRSRNAMYQDLI
ncbi:MAG TPA: hypothetical protein VE692_02565, partial [Nitrososphaera sp.]|nr:hypothetical protein [Nitrososphaera sp.]